MSSFDAIMKYAGMVMAVLYIVMGLAVMLRARELFNIPSDYALPVGGLLLGYGIFRGYRIYQKYYHR